MTTADADVLVLGAGLSGLETALTLEDNGLKALRPLSSSVRAVSRPERPAPSTSTSASAVVMRQR